MINGYWALMRLKKEKVHYFLFQKNFFSTFKITYLLQ